jgi:hypothetical protein
MVPYSEASTLDNRIRHYRRLASDKLAAAIGYRYPDRIFRNFIEISAYANATP